MNTSLPLTQTPTGARWAGRIVSGLVVAFMLFDLIGKVLVIQPVIDAQTHLGFPVELSQVLGAIEVVCVALYLLPATAPLGALLLTAYLGGATAIHVRIGDPWFFPVLMGVLAWVGLLLRDERARGLLPGRRDR